MNDCTLTIMMKYQILFYTVTVTRNLDNLLAKIAHGASADTSRAATEVDILLTFPFVLRV